MMLEDATAYVRVANIYKPENFDKSLRPAAEFIKEHSDKHKTMPDRLQISATTGIKLQSVPDLNDGHFDWFMGEFESFTKRQEIERAVLKAADLLEAGDFDPIEKLIKDAGYRVIIHTDSVEPETDLTGEVLRDENMNLTLVRPVIHATKLEILNG